MINIKKIISIILITAVLFTGCSAEKTNENNDQFKDLLFWSNKAYSRQNGCGVAVYEDGSVYWYDYNSKALFSSADDLPLHLADKQVSTFVTTIPEDEMAEFIEKLSKNAKHSETIYTESRTDDIRGDLKCYAIYKDEPLLLGGTGDDIYTNTNEPLTEIYERLIELHEEAVITTGHEDVYPW
ncbi:MAG: hypothetical protein IJZ47_01270 [Oscillospiraceae bacterium]|nr:hypothetical protein [Oscillospiraceae bacterium]